MPPPLTNSLCCPLRRNTTISKFKDAEDLVYECERLKQDNEPYNNEPEVCRGRQSARGRFEANEPTEGQKT